MQNDMVRNSETSKYRAQTMHILRQRSDSVCGFVLVTQRMLLCRTQSVRDVGRGVVGLVGGTVRVFRDSAVAICHSSTLVQGRNDEQLKGCGWRLDSKGAATAFVNFTASPPSWSGECVSARRSQAQQRGRPPALSNLSARRSLCLPPSGAACRITSAAVCPAGTWSRPSTSLPT